MNESVSIIVSNLVIYVWECEKFYMFILVIWINDNGPSNQYVLCYTIMLKHIASAIYIPVLTYSNTCITFVSGLILFKVLGSILL